ncbi:hypothetical protein LRP52_34265 [Photobacterium sp. ZSDE20]|uniref:Uncharacterized protein n=1 Tax=Photobacterium pectinilyticum TaxID=2906793 RepID=A0ABT1N5Q3_9GAMM|nr:hypothetical protein [Photobacterium sp. ZSDE20]MCQ1060073.1 hypothetical protein [Photobacterium sp. ZSDE20]MDD1827253.1 hypothetical protein [Photobacterium sp. ZSDE20]
MQTHTQYPLFIKELALEQILECDHDCLKIDVLDNESKIAPMLSAQLGKTVIDHESLGDYTVLAFATNNTNRRAFFILLLRPEDLFVWFDKVEGKFKFQLEDGAKWLGTWSGHTQSFVWSQGNNQGCDYRVLYISQDELASVYFKQSGSMDML